MGFIVNKQEAREASVRFEECVYSFVASHVGQKPSYLQLRDCTRIMVCFCAKMRRGRGEKERGETERERETVEQRVEDQIIVYFMSHVL